MLLHTYQKGQDKKTVATINVGDKAQNLGHSCIAGGDVECYGHSGVWLGSFWTKTKLNIKLQYDTAIVLLDFIPEKWKHMFTQESILECSLQRYLSQPKNVHNSDTCQCGNGETNRGTSVLWTGPQSLKGRGIHSCNNVNESPGIYPEWRKPVPKGYILHHSIYIKFQNEKKKPFRYGALISGCQGLGSGWGRDRSGCGRERATGMILVATEMFPMMTTSLWTPCWQSHSGLQFCNTLPLRETGKVYTISFSTM